MIKVIACDMDGTLLGPDHKVSPRTLRAVKRAQEKGIRFMIATGRNFKSAMEELKDLDLTCDYLVGSGAEVRTPDQKIIKSCPISAKLCREAYEVMKEYPISILFSGAEYDYRIGTEEEVEEGLLRQIELFHLDMSREEIVKSELYQRIKRTARAISRMEELEEKQIPVYKMFAFSSDISMLDEINRKLEANEGLAVASSFATNVEITAAEAQKGPVLKEYIESLGYRMEEVMVFGDSLNDYSMLSMDFGATVAMENGDPRVKAEAKYIAPGNEEDGVAQVIEKLLLDLE